MAPGLMRPSERNRWTKTEALKAETSQSLSNCQSLKPHRERWHALPATALATMAPIKTTRLPDFHNPSLCGQRYAGPRERSEQHEAFVMRVTYEQSLKDHKTLWAIGPAYDMTGGYTDSEDLELLLNNPTKTTARKCLVSQINYWFQVGIEKSQDSQALIDKYPEVAEIAERYGYA